MSDENQKVTQDILMADAMLRLSTLEKILIDKGIITQQEVIDAATTIAEKIAKIIREKADQSNNLNAFVADLSTKQ